MITTHVEGIGQVADSAEILSIEVRQASDLATLSL